MLRILSYDLACQLIIENSLQCNRFNFFYHHLSKSAAEESEWEIFKWLDMLELLLWVFIW